MKKLIAGLLVVVVAWTGTSFVIGKQAETLYQDLVADLEVLPGQDSIRFEIVDYQRSLFRSTMRTCLTIDDSMPALAAFSDYLCDDSVVHHGPVAWTSDGPFFGLLYSRGNWDYGSLPEPFQDFVADIFAGDSPLQSELRVGFGGQARGVTWVPAFVADLPGARIALDELMIAVDSPDLRAHPLEGTFRVRDFSIVEPTGHIQLAALDGALTLTDILDDLLPIFDLDIAVTGINVEQYAGPGQEARFDLNLQSSTELNGDTVGGGFTVSLNNLSAPAMGLPVDGGYASWELRGLDTDGTLELLRVYDEFNRVQSAMMVDMMRMFGDDGAEPTVDMEALSVQLAARGEELARVMAESWLRPGETFSTATLSGSSNGQQQLSFDGRLDYQGVAGQNPVMEAWMLLEDEDLFALANAELMFTVNEMLLAPMAEVAQMLIGEGLLTVSDGFYHANASFREGELTVNGNPVLLEEYLALLGSMSGTGNGYQDMDDLDIDACFAEYDNPADFPSYCYDWGLTPEY